MSTQDSTPLGILRGVWNAGDQGATNLDEIDAPNICKRTEGLDFGNFGNFGDAEGVGSTGDLRTAWRAKLAREGKLVTGPEAVSLRQLVLGSGDVAGDAGDAGDQVFDDEVSR